MTDAAFWDRRARKYAKQPISNMTAYEKTLERARAHLKPTDRVAEMGCGTGTTALLLAPSVREYTGLDVSEEMIQIATEKLDAAPMDGVEFRVAQAATPPDDLVDLDAVLSFNLYHLVPNWRRAIATAGSRVRPGGLFITKTPCLEGKVLIRMFVWIMRVARQAPHVEFFSVDQFEKAIKDAGFQIIETGFYPDNSRSRFVVARKM